MANKLSYSSARQIRQSGLSNQITERLLSGEGISSSFSQSISESLLAKVTGIKEKLDPLNIAKMMMGGSALGPALLGRMMGRSSQDIEHFAGTGKAKQKKDPLLLGMVKRTQDNIRVNDSFADALGKLYTLFKTIDDDEKLAAQLRKDFQQERIEEEQRRNEEVIRQIKKVALKAKKINEKARKQQEQKKDEDKKRKERDTKPDDKTKGGTGTSERVFSAISSGVRRAATVAAGAAAVIYGSNVIASVVETGEGYNIVKRPDGSVEKQKGRRNWRNNNPGNIEYGPFAKSQGAIGTDGRFAIFPSYEVGRKAKEELIFSGKSYRNLKLSEAIARYAPPSENDTGMYRNSVLSAVGGSDKIMSEYTPSERTSIMNAMQKVEGFKEGTVEQIQGANIQNKLVSDEYSQPKDSSEMQDKSANKTSEVQSVSSSTKNNANKSAQTTKTRTEPTQLATKVSSEEFSAKLMSKTTAQTPKKEVGTYMSNISTENKEIKETLKQNVSLFSVGNNVNLTYQPGNKVVYNMEQDSSDLPAILR